MEAKTQTIQVRVAPSLKAKIEKHAEGKNVRATRWLWLALADKARAEGDEELANEILAQM